ncbi:Lipase 3 [Yarrowia sp. B02]|nr:Lipase 3 [Yarrowia sp. B02]
MELPSLNATIKGNVVQHGNVEQFLNIRYADIPGKFQKPVLKSDWQGAEIDATKPGPVSPQSRTPFNFFSVPDDLWEKVNVDTYQDGLLCANLMVTRPAGISPNARLPTVVWIHGGSNLEGSIYNAIYEPQHLVAESIRVGKPIVHVCVEYRLGLTGFLTQNGKGNWGSWDQYTGCQWVNRHIGDFGGDPANVTLTGESAGSVAVHNMLIKDSMNGRKLFRNAVLMSGTLETITPQPPTWHKRLEDKVAKVSNAEPASLSDKELLKAQVKLNVAVCMTCDDGDFFEPGWKAHLVPDWLDKLVISDCKDEGMLYFLPINAQDDDELLAKVDKSPVGKEIADLYDIKAGSDVKSGCLDLKTDATFNYWNHLLFKKMQAAHANGASARVYRLAVDEPNPHNPDQRAHHAVDVLYMFNSTQFNEHGDRLSRLFQSHFLRLAYGLEPWDHRNFGVYRNGGYQQLPLAELSSVRPVARYEALEKMDFAQDTYHFELDEGDWIHLDGLGEEVRPGEVITSLVEAVNQNGQVTLPGPQVMTEAMSEVMTEAMSSEEDYC